MIIDLLRELNELDEHPSLEAKTCAGGDLGDSFFETVCASWHTTLAREHATLAATHTTLGNEHGTLAGDHGTLTLEHGTLTEGHGTLGMDLPADLQSRIRELGSRPGEKIRPLILDLCAIRPLSATLLASILGDRNPRALKREHLEPMRSSGELTYVYPEMERHPQQAYRTTPQSSTDY